MYRHMHASFKSTEEILPDPHLSIQKSDGVYSIEKVENDG